MIALAGNIATGKTTVVNKIANKLGYFPIFENVSGNPFLDLFYDNKSRWAFHSQIFFMQDRFDSARTACSVHGSSVVLDRSIHEDFHVFCNSLINLKHLSDAEFTILKKIYTNFNLFTPSISKIIYLSADTETIINRIRIRDRNFEKSIDGEYIDLLNSFYKKWLKELDQEMIIEIDTGVNDLNDDDIFSEMILSHIV